MLLFCYCFSDNEMNGADSLECGMKKKRSENERNIGVLNESLTACRRMNLFIRQYSSTHSQARYSEMGQKVFFVWFVSLLIKCFFFFPGTAANITQTD